MIKQAITYSVRVISFALLAPNINAESIDDYGRNLQSHENLGGHTIAKHVSKSETWLRNRCKSEKYLITASTFSSLSDAESILADMIKDNRSLVQDYASGRNSNGAISEQESWWERPLGYGSAINCKLLNKKKTYTINLRGKKIPITVELDDINYLPSATGVLRKKSTASGGWFLLTSYPSL